MKRTLQVLTVLAAAAMLNGCTKCSGDRPAETPPAAEMAAPPSDTSAPAGDVGNTNAPAEGGDMNAPTETK